MVFGKIVELQRMDTDRYDRTVGSGAHRQAVTGGTAQSWPGMGLRLLVLGTDLRELEALPAEG